MCYIQEVDRKTCKGILLCVTVIYCNVHFNRRIIVSLFQEMKRLKQLELEKKILDAQTENAQLVNVAAQQRQQVLAQVAFVSDHI